MATHPTLDEQTLLGGQGYKFRDPELSIEERIDNLISLMTLDEKVDCLATYTRVPRLGIPGTEHMEGLHGLSVGGPRAGDLKPLIEPSHRDTETRAVFQPGLGPICTTIFPQAIGLGETWDTKLVKEVAEAQALEARFIAHSPDFRTGGLIVMAPNADLARDPRWGRTEECFGEDAFLAGSMAVAFVNGLQGDHPKYWNVAALLKHFFANSNEDGRSVTSSNMDERLLYEYYTLPFRMGMLEGGSKCYMTAYNAVNGIPAGVMPAIRELTIEKWDQDGIICTDGGAMEMLVTEHKAFEDTAHAVQATLKAGITKYLEAFKPSVIAALERGLIQESDLDAAMRPNFRVLIRLGLLDPESIVPFTRVPASPPWESEGHKALARRAVQESVVLLKNDQDFLPLESAGLNSIAVIGNRADTVLLDWYSGLPAYTVSPLDGIIKRAAPGTTVLFNDGRDVDSATNLAARSDVVILCVGNDPCGGKTSKWAEVTLPSEGREAIDRQSLTLEDEERLIKKVFAANPNTIVVLVSSFPYTINWTQDNVPAILHLTHCCQELGNGLADVLFGDYNPAGRLVQTWPRSVADLPDMMDYDIRNGRTYMYAAESPLYPFGFGLSYTQFRYSNLAVTALDGSIEIRFDLENSGRREGSEVVQVYVQRHESKVSRPNKELKAFERVHLGSKDTVRVALNIDTSRLQHWNEATQAFVIEPGPISVLVGASSADIRLTATAEITE